MTTDTGWKTTIDPFLLGEAVDILELVLYASLLPEML
jgi:hypothetical protein